MGASGSGKDYLANYLVQNHAFTRFSFSDQLKVLAHTIYPWLDIDYPPIKKEESLNITTSTGETICHSPREIWLHLDNLRKVENLIFIRMLELEVKQFFKGGTFSENNVIITDIRSEEEFKWCRNNDFKIMYISPSKQVYKQYDIDKHINEKKNEVDFSYTNNFNGTDDFGKFYKEHIKNE